MLAKNQQKWWHQKKNWEQITSNNQEVTFWNNSWGLGQETLGLDGTGLVLGWWQELMALQKRLDQPLGSAVHQKRGIFCKADSGWWFGTWILFFHILGIIIPTDFHIFERVQTTNQDWFWHILTLELWRFGLETPLLPACWSQNVNCWKQSSESSFDERKSWYHRRWACWSGSCGHIGQKIHGIFREGLRTRSRS